jgi:hypothetical protein
VTLPVPDEWLQASRSFTEAEALAELWAHGEDAWLREDDRFRPSPWGRWIGSDRYLINDLLVRALRQDGVSELLLSEQLQSLAGVVGRPTAFCPGDPRLRVDEDRVRLAARELGREPLLEDVGPLLQFRTHLPVLSLKAAAASEPAGEWGPGAEPQEVRPLGWLRVESPGRPLNRRMFVAQVRGRSMDDGRTGLVDGAWAVFEFSFHAGQFYDAGSGRPVVLVRGEFSDPETGSYAVKRWDRADPEVRLVSANGDKARYPDIVVPAEAADHLRIVATFALALGPTDFARRPRPARRPGLRLLDGRGRAGRGRAPARAAARELLRGGARGGRRRGRGAAAWHDRLAHPAGLPRPGLGRSAARARAAGGAAAVREEAARGGLETGRASCWPPTPACARIACDVSPGTGPWRWEAVGFEEEGEELELARLDLDALDDQGPSLFRVDAAGVGQLLAGRSLAPGQRYRLLIPPAKLAAVDGEELPGELACRAAGACASWTWTAEVDATLAARLNALGLTLGEMQPRLEWALIPPTAWHSTTRGESYAVFGPRAAPALQVRGLPGADEAPTELFLRGPDGSTDRLTLPPPARRWCDLDGAPSGSLGLRGVASVGAGPGQHAGLRGGREPGSGRRPRPGASASATRTCGATVRRARPLAGEHCRGPRRAGSAGLAGAGELARPRPGLPRDAERGRGRHARPLAVLPVLHERIRRQPLGYLIIDLASSGRSSCRTAAGPIPRRCASASASTSARAAPCWRARRGPG